MIIGLTKENDNLFKFNPAFGDLKKDNDYKSYIYANSEVNNLPDVFKFMAVNHWHSVSIEMDKNIFKEKITKNDKGNLVIRGLEPQHFNYVLTGEMTANQPCTYFYANLKAYYCRLVSSIPDFPHITNSLNFSRVSKHNHDAGEFYKKEAENRVYIFQKCYGYLGVYYCMFNAFFDSIVGNYKNQQVHLHVVSIGCGIKNDALALKYAIENRKDIQFKEVKYVGMDPGSWANKQNKYLFCYNKDDKYFKIEVPKTCNKKKYYVEKDIEILNFIDEEINEFAKNAASIFLIVFPNMLSEMDTDGVTELVKHIKKEYKEKKTYILLSRNPSSNSSNKRIDDPQAAVINKECYALLTQRVLSFEDTKKTKKGEKGYYIDDDSFLPNKITDRVREFIQFVEGHSINNKKWNKKNRNSKNRRKNSTHRNAIIRSKYIQYEVYELFGENQ